MLFCYRLLFKIETFFDNIFAYLDYNIRKRITYRITRKLKKQFPNIIFYISFYSMEKQFIIEYNRKYIENLRDIVYYYENRLWENKILQIKIGWLWNEEGYKDSENLIKIF